MPTSLTDAEDALRLLTQAAERLPQIIRIAEADELSWFLEFADGEGFLVEWSSEWSRLVLTADLGVPPPQGELAALNLALSYNALWRDIGDLRIARDGEGGELLLIGELGPDDGDPETVDAALLHFDTLRRWWTEAIARGADGGDVPSSNQALLLGRV